VRRRRKSYTAVAASDRFTTHVIDQRAELP